MAEQKLVEIKFNKKERDLPSGLDVVYGITVKEDAKNYVGACHPEVKKALVEAGKAE